VPCNLEARSLGSRCRLIIVRPRVSAFGLFLFPFWKFAYGNTGFTKHRGKHSPFLGPSRWELFVHSDNDFADAALNNGSGTL
jgi:hypothetical protein